MATGKKNNVAHEVPKIPTSAELLKAAAEKASRDKESKQSDK